jgi:hypothetical protein
MKTSTLTFLFAFAFSLSAFATQDSLLDRQLDSVHYALLKPRLENYIAKAEDISEKIKSSSDKKAIRLYSKQLSQMTDSILVTANKIYGYKKISGSGQAFVIQPNGELAYGYVQGSDVIVGKLPPVNETLDKLSSASGTMFFFPSIKNSRSAKIDKLIADLKKY